MKKGNGVRLIPVVSKLLQKLIFKFIYFFSKTTQKWLNNTQLNKTT